MKTGWLMRARMVRRIFAMAQGPWGGSPGGNGDDGGSGDKGKDSGGSGSGNGDAGNGPRNPWTQPRGGNRPGGQPSGSRPSMVDDLIRRSREGFSSFGGPGGGMPGTPEVKALWPIAIAIVVLLWIALSSFHRIGPQERGVVTVLGKYSRTLTPGIGLTLPAPFEMVETVDVEEIRTIDIGSVRSEAENLMLTGDQNMIDLAYSVRWNIRSPELYKFQLSDPDSTVREVAETAMRSVVATISLNQALGSGRTLVEQQVEQRMQEILDNYRSGIRVQGIAIKQADPPSAVNDAFKDVSAAQQAAQTYINEARAYSQQLTARAQGEAAAFDKVYEQYRLSPEVTRRRMYYETMEAVLANVDKTVVETGNVTPYLPLPGITRKAPLADPPSASAPSQGGR